MITLVIASLLGLDVFLRNTDMFREWDYTPSQLPKRASYIPVVGLDDSRPLSIASIRSRLSSRPALGFLVAMVAALMLLVTVIVGLYAANVNRHTKPPIGTNDNDRPPPPDQPRTIVVPPWYRQKQTWIIVGSIACAVVVALSIAIGWYRHQTKLWCPLRNSIDTSAIRGSVPVPAILSDGGGKDSGKDQAVTPPPTPTPSPTASPQKKTSPKKMPESPKKSPPRSPVRPLVRRHSYPGTAPRHSTIEDDEADADPEPGQTTRSTDRNVDKEVVVVIEPLENDE